MRPLAATFLGLFALGVAGTDLLLHLRSEVPQIRNEVSVPPFQLSERQVVVEPAKVVCPPPATPLQGALTPEQLNLLLQKIEVLQAPIIQVAPSTVRPYMWCSR